MTSRSVPSRSPAFSYPTLLRRASILLLLNIAISAQAASPERGWPAFRGPSHNGSSPERNLNAQWAEKGPEVLWKMPVGAGFSEIVIAGDAFYTLFSAPEEGSDKKSEFVGAFAVKNGKELWRVRLGEEFVNQFGNGPRATPFISGDRIVAVGSYGNLFSLDRATGKVHWSVDLQEKFGTTTPRFGVCVSPIMTEKAVLMELSGVKDKGYVAFDRETGSVLWQKYSSGNGYMSPILAPFAGNPQWVLLTGGKLTGLHLDGTQAWDAEWVPNSIAHPLFVPPDKLFVSAAGDVGAAMFQIDAKADPIAPRELWRSRSMKNHFSSSVTQDGHIYGFDNATLKCISTESGEQKWAKRGFGKGTLILADDCLWVLSDRGKLTTVAATPEAYREHAAYQALKGKCWTAPSLAEGKLYLRNHEEMICLGIGSKP
ncbi:PQQ-like beta-propeller repeat protein [Sulfidibacter corallicola]|uniref:PQQ-like beta-propeller repeat protein n=1 Tax=Sulfidibacter corallicola TaxID=2818388 RepID=A0A8A4TMH3_SULCO|nr:PQQ-binding-like beta-propeller repeat protein [Sulfidibacter corallicola]QTD47795.1 PQQ-like beta-propeller repeat protein [Sulfidibacter corallicola]